MKEYFAFMKQPGAGLVQFELRGRLLDLSTLMVKC